MMNRDPFHFIGHDVLYIIFLFFYVDVTLSIHL